VTHCFVREKTDDRAATIATAHNCKQFEHFVCDKKTPNQTRPDVFVVIKVVVVVVVVVVSVGCGCKLVPEIDIVHKQLA